MKKQTVIKFPIKTYNMESTIQKYIDENNCFVVCAVPVANSGVTQYILVVFEQNA